MPVLMVGEASGLTEEIYLQMFEALRPLMQSAPGFVLHTAHAIEGGGFRVLEVWQSKEASDRFFAAHVAPKLPPGVRPKRRTEPLASLLVPSALAF